MHQNVLAWEFETALGATLVGEMSRHPPKAVALPLMAQGPALKAAGRGVQSGSPGRSPLSDRKSAAQRSAASELASVRRGHLVARAPGSLLSQLPHFEYGGNDMSSTPATFTGSSYGTVTDA